MEKMTREELYKGLTRCRIMDRLAEDEIARLDDIAGLRFQEFKKGEFIFSEGDKVTEIAILIDGSVSITKDDLDGRRSVIAVVEPGEIFAETFVAAEYDSIPVNAMCEKDSHLAFISYKSLMSFETPDLPEEKDSQILARYRSDDSIRGRILDNLMKVLVRKNLIQNRKLQLISRRTTREKLMAYLRMEAERAGSNSFDISLDRQGLADFLCVDRSAMSSELGHMRDEGMIEFRKNHFVIL